ncbi:MAG: DUF547 domain-containing protein [Halobacteriales archaeon]
MDQVAGHASGATESGPTDPESLDPSACARELLEAVRAGEDTTPYRTRLGAYDDADLAVLREDRAAALAFWLNLYNAGTQVLLEERPELYASPLRFFRFFGTACLTVAGTGVSLDLIEQGILRGSRSKYGLGYLPRLLPSRFERRYRLDEPDPRIHFALNCGAASCPPIRSFAPDRIDEQLDMATAGYLETSVEYDPADDVARLPRVFLWYRGDFGGRSGMRDLLREYDIIPADTRPRLRYQSWDWTREPGKFVE